MNSLVKTFAVIQGASSGIGLALVNELMESCDTQLVIATCRNLNSSSELKSLVQVYGQRLKILSLDPTLESSAVSLAKVLSEQPTSIELLVNCSGLLHDSKLQPEKKNR